MELSRLLWEEGILEELSEQSRSNFGCDDFEDFQLFGFMLAIFCRKDNCCCWGSLRILLLLILDELDTLLLFLLTLL